MKLISTFCLFLFGLFASTAYGQEPNDLKNARWIGDNKQQPAVDSLMYGDDPAPLFRKEFTVNKNIKTAKLLVTAAGYYSATVNGIALDKNYCDPAWTDFRKRVYYSEYDIKNELLKGKNCIGITLGNGFYNSLPMMFWRKYNLRKALATGRPMLIAKIRIEYSNGKTEEFSTDESWKYAYGPILRNNVYLGEVYDARREIKGWNKPGFDDSRWANAITKDGPGGKLQKTFFPHIQAIGTHKPTKISQTSNNVFVIDMGVNFTGTFKIKMSGKAGNTVKFRFGERIYPNGQLNPMTAVAGQIKAKGRGGPGAPELAEQGGTYIFGSETEAEYCPVLSFRVFRYMEISGLEKAPELDDIQGIALSTNVTGTNSFSCSSELINSIQEITARTFLSNLMSVQSDCPGREKFGYGGDLLATNEAFIYNFDMQTFYRKTLNDWIDNIQDSVFIDTAPYVGLKYCGLNFESAIFDLQRNLLHYYGDTAIVREMYNFNLNWMDKAARIHPSGIVDKGLADHEALINVPVQLLGTAAYLRTALIMKEFANIMHDKGNAERFETLEKHLKNELKKMFWNENNTDKSAEAQSKNASMTYINTLPEQEKQKALKELEDRKELINRQTLYTLLLHNDVVPEADKKKATDLLLDAVNQAPEQHFTTGIFGTKYILETLSELGYSNTVFDIVNSDKYPGWGFMVKNGATTLWETWKESDNVYSNCHPMFGSVSAWFYRYLAGIRPLAGFPGFKKFSIAPTVPDKLDYVNCNYNSPFGKISSNWKKDKNGNLVFDIEIPAGTTAVIKLPTDKLGKIDAFDKTTREAVVLKIMAPDGSFELKAGNYQLSTRLQ